MKIFNSVWSLVKRYPIQVSFLIVSSVILYLNLTPTEFLFHYDSHSYWIHSSDFIKNGYFSFLNYDFPARGYLFPFIIFVVSSTSRLIGISSYHGYEVVMSLAYSIMISVVIPDFIYLLFHKKPRLPQILIFGFLFLYLFLARLPFLSVNRYASLILCSTWRIFNSEIFKALVGCRNFGSILGWFRIVTPILPDITVATTIMGMLFLLQQNAPEYIPDNSQGPGYYYWPSYCFFPSSSH